MAELRIPIIGEFKGKKAFSDAEKATGKLDKSTKKLGKAILAAFSIQKIAQFGKAAAKAFIEDEKAASQLAQSVKNLGLSFEVPRIEAFIESLAKASGVTDDELRPSMQKLLQTTGSVTKSQELLTQALDISRGSGVAYETVVEDLTKAYVGQTRGLDKYKLGLTRAELKTIKFADVQERLTKQFSGANAAYLETYAGKLGLLSNAAGEATEIIGKGLLDSLSILAGEGNTVQPLADSMLELAQGTSDVIVGLADIASGLKNLGGLGDIKFGTKGATLGDLFSFNLNMIPILGPILEAARLRGQKINNPAAGRFFNGGSGNNLEEERIRRKVEADAAKRAKELAALQNKTLDTQKKKLALDRASKTLNIEAIGIEAALKGKISETDRISLLLQKAILEGNASLATKLSDQLNEATKRNEQLRLAILATPKAPNPYENWKIPDDVLAWTAASLGVTVSALGTTPVPISSTFSDAQMELAAAVNAGQAAEQKLINVQVYLDGDMVGNAVRDSSINQSLSGSFNSVNRRGRFAPVAE
jgi:hypothetical protein